MPTEDRAQMLCGWLNSKRWPAPQCECADSSHDLMGLGDCRYCRSRRQLAVMVPGSRTVPTQCPGYTSRLEAVVHTMRLWGWWERGQLELRCPDPDELQMDYIEVFNMHRAMAESHYMELVRKESQHGAV